MWKRTGARSTRPRPTHPPVTHHSHPERQRNRSQSLPSIESARGATSRGSSTASRCCAKKESGSLRREHGSTVDSVARGSTDGVKTRIIAHRAPLVKMTASTVEPHTTHSRCASNTCGGDAWPASSKGLRARKPRVCAPGASGASRRSSGIPARRASTTSFRCPWPIGRTIGTTIAAGLCRRQP